MVYALAVRPRIHEITRPQTRAVLWSLDCGSTLEPKVLSHLQSRKCAASLSFYKTPYYTRNFSLHLDWKQSRSRGAGLCRPYVE